MTSQQLTTLKTAINGDPTWAAFPMTTDGYIDLANVLGQTASPAFYVYNPRVPVQAVFDQVNWANLTPVDTPDTTQQWANRSLACQGKQFNLQTILIGASGTLDASRSSVRAGLQDALTNVPSGAGGATQAAGWVGVRDNALARPATNFEKIFATGQNGSTPALAATMTLEGKPEASDVLTARNS